jgi:hypothetical protein
MARGHGFNRPYGTNAIDGNARIPSDESLGYSQPSLRDEIRDPHDVGWKPILAIHDIGRLFGVRRFIAAFFVEPHYPLMKGCHVRLAHSCRSPRERTNRLSHPSGGCGKCQFARGGRRVDGWYGAKAAINRRTPKNGRFT